MKAIIHKLIFRGNKLHRVEVSHPWDSKRIFGVDPAQSFIAIDKSGCIGVYEIKPVTIEKDAIGGEVDVWVMLRSGTSYVLGFLDHGVEDWKDSLCEIVLPDLEHHHD